MKNKNKNQTPLSRQVGTSPLDKGAFNSGQIAIVVLLISAVLLTLGLSSSRKTVTDIKVDTDEELLKEAFNAAESGINNYINIGNTKYSALSGGAGAVVDVKTIGGNGATSLSSDGLVQPGSHQIFWLVNHDVNTGDIGIAYYNGTSVEVKSENNLVALKVDYFYIDSSGTHQIERAVCKYSVFNDGNAVGFSECPVNLTVAGRSPLLVLVTPIGGASKITLTGTGGGEIPLQGEELTSVGTAANGVKTQIKTRNTYQIPSFLTEAITARNIIK